MSQHTAASSGANGHSSVQDIFVLTDEQILEIDREPQDVEVVEAAQPSPSPNSTDHAAGSQPESAADAPSQQPAPTETATPAPFTAPDDMRALAELYPGGLSQAKTAAERARLLDDIDRAYFGAQGNTPEQSHTARAQLAAMMMREDPAAFRELVFEGLRALEAADPSARPRSLADALDRGADASTANISPVGATLGSPSGQSATTASGTANSAPTGLGNHQTAHRAAAEHQAHLAAYAAFENAANADLEKSVGGAIERALHQAFPNVGAGFSPSPGGATHEAAPLQARLSQAIREDVEKALQNDRQLGEQVGQILAGRRFDDDTRSQIVRLINDRAQQLVPGAAKRALNDWTQATLAAHRGKTARSESTSSRREVAAAAPALHNVNSSNNSVAHPFRGEASRAGASTRQPAQNQRLDGQSATRRRVDYHKLSDEQILDL